MSCYGLTANHLSRYVMGPEETRDSCRSSGASQPWKNFGKLLLNFYLRIALAGSLTSEPRGCQALPCPPPQTAARVLNSRNSKKQIQGTKTPLSLRLGSCVLVRTKHHDQKNLLFQCEGKLEFLLDISQAPRTIKWNRIANGSFVHQINRCQGRCGCVSYTSHSPC